MLIRYSGTSFPTPRNRVPSSAAPAVDIHGSDDLFGLVLDYTISGENVNANLNNKFWAYMKNNYRMTACIAHSQITIVQTNQVWWKAIWPQHPPTALLRA